VLMMRGECSFLEKAIAAQNVGARGAIIFNNERDDIDSQIDMVDDGSGKGPQVDIPVMWIGGKNGHMILHSIKEVKITKFFSSKLGNPGHTFPGLSFYTHIFNIF